MIYNDVNIITEQIIKLQEKARHSGFIAAYEDTAFFDNLHGNISAQSVLKLLELSVWDKYARYYLVRILEFADATTITDEVFQKVKRYPWRGARRSFFVTIAHCDISLYQLQYICKKKYCFEAFASLLQIYTKYDCYSILDLKRLLLENKCFWHVIKWEEIIFENVPSEKTELILMLINRDLLKPYQ